MYLLTDNPLGLQVKKGPFFDEENKILEIQVDPQGNTDCEIFCRYFPIRLSVGAAKIRVENQDIIFETINTQEMIKLPLSEDSKIVKEIIAKLGKEYTGKADLGGFGRKSLILSFYQDAFCRFGNRADIKRLRSRPFARCTPPKSKRE